MKKIISLLILALILICCKDKTETKIELPKSDFNLKNDYRELTKKISKLDTIEIFVGLSICEWERTERLTLTKFNDSLKILIEATEIENNKPLKVTEIIKIHQNDTVWRFEDFLIKINDKQKFIDNSPNFIIVHNSDSIKYYTNGLSEMNDFIADYYNTMFRLNPKNKLYEGMKIISEEKY